MAMAIRDALPHASLPVQRGQLEAERRHLGVLDVSSKVKHHGNRAKLRDAALAVSRYTCQQPLLSWAAKQDKGG